MLKLSSRSLVCVVLALFIQRAAAGPAARESVARITAASDAIVIGTVVSTMANGVVNARIEVERVVKGSLREGSSLSVLWTSPQARLGAGPPFGNASSSNGHGLFFLEQGGAGSWSLLPATLGDAEWEDTYISTPASVPRTLRDAVEMSLPSEASALDKVLAEIVIATEADGRAPVDIVALFREQRSQVLATAFTRFAAKENAALRLIGIRGQILKGDSSAILTVRRSAPGLSVTRGWRDVLEEIKVYFVNTEPGAIQTLGEIATDAKAGVDLRIAAAGALARMHAQRALPYLAALLSDDSAKLRAMGVAGLARFANNVQMGSNDIASGYWPYRTDETIAHSSADEARIAARESYYIDFWRQWWQEHRSTLEQE